MNHNINSLNNNLHPKRILPSRMKNLNLFIKANKNQISMNFQIEDYQTNLEKLIQALLIYHRLSNMLTLINYLPIKSTLSSSRNMRRKFFMSSYIGSKRIQIRGGISINIRLIYQIIEEYQLCQSAFTQMSLFFMNL